MQDPYYQAMMKQQPQFPEHEQLKCPRCESTNTKFCYYNNYNLSQPRHFCKSCRRYWTKGGALRNIPVGGGSRKNTKRSSKRQGIKNPDPNPIRSSQDPSGSGQDPSRVYGSSLDQESKVLDMSGSFSSLLAANVQFLEGSSPKGSGLKAVRVAEFGSGSVSDREPGMGLRGGGGANGEQNYCWSGSSNGWPELAIYTPSSGFQ